MHTLSGLPSTIRVGPFSYELQVTSALESMQSQTWGSCANVEHIIRLQEHYPCVGRCIDTVLHEILHALYHVHTIPEKEDEETTVAMMGTGLASLLMDNPALVQWIADTTKAYDF
jgi:hypothetical protein